MNQDRYNEMRERNMTEALMQAQINSQNMNQATQSMMMANEEKGIIYEQLDLTEHLELIENLLRGRVKKKNENGEYFWDQPISQNSILFTETGVTEIMNCINWYINKNTLLSNYSEEVINDKMRDFANALNDLIFMNYHIYFEMPSLQECKLEFVKRIEKKIEMRKFAYDILGTNYNEKEIRKEFIVEFEAKLEKELDEIKESLFDQKLARYEMVIRTVQDAVHSTYLRALFGAERRTLRQHINITESNNQGMNQIKKGGMFSGFKSQR